MKKDYLKVLNYNDIYSHYNARVVISSTLQDLLRSGDKAKYSELALGISDPYGNYSASQHGLGEKILSVTSENKIFELAGNLNLAKTDKDVSKIIYEANIPNLKVSVGTEMAMLLQPDIHWLANTRSIWAYLLEKNNKINIANEALRLYLKGSEDSKMNYKIWSEIHGLMKQPLLDIAKQGKGYISAGMIVNLHEFIWADAIANALYDNFSG